MSKILLSCAHMTSNELLYVKEAMDKLQFSNFGDNLSGFENDLEAYLKEDVHIACLSSGTAAIHLALIQLGIGYQDEVICQSFTFSGTANPIIYQRAIPVFIDSEKDTWNMCPYHLEKAIKSRISKGKKPKAIIIVHLFGMPANMNAIMQIGTKYEIPIIEDAAEALGSEYKGRKCGTFGTFGIFSFNGNKIITSSGGGALVCLNKKIKNDTIFYATQARDDYPYYEHSKIGYNYRMSNVNAGIGRAQIKVLDNYVGLRRNVNLFYKALFKDVKGVEVMEEPNSDYYSNFWLSCIVINDRASFSAEEFRLALEKENIETRPLWKPMHLQPVFKEAPFYGNGFSETLFKTGLCLPSGSNLTKDDLDRITQVVKRII